MALVGSDFTNFGDDVAVMRRTMAASGRLLTYCVLQMHNNPDGWRQGPRHGRAPGPPRSGQPAITH